MAALFSSGVLAVSEAARVSAERKEKVSEMACQLLCRCRERKSEREREREIEREKETCTHSNTKTRSPLCI
jgi:hypothetical protein